MSQPLKDMHITQSFGEDPTYYAKWHLKGHHGADLRAAEMTDGFAVEEGEIVIAQNGVADPLTGDYVSGLVCVLVSKKYSWWYLHGNKLLVKPGQKVKAGQRIVLTGNTGASVDPHLHLGCRPHDCNVNNGYRGFVDPMPVLKEIDMLVDITTADVMYRLYTGHPASDYAKEHVIGKMTAAELQQHLRKSTEFKNLQAAAKTGKLNPLAHLPAELRDVYKKPEVKVLAPGNYVVKEAKEK